MSKYPRTFCVTLKETPVRARGFLESSLPEGMRVEYFYGVFGQRMGLTPHQPNEIECPGMNIFMTDGAVGCYLSHFVLWNVLSYLPEDEFFVVEDDAVFVEGFAERFADCYKRLPSDWEMVYVGWLPWGDGKDRVMVGDGISIRHPSATHAYLIKKSLLRRAIEAIQPCGSPIDLLIANRLLPTIKYYVFDPSLVTQRSYLNTADPAWNSLVYDWKNDLYGCKKKLIENLALTDGWHAAEQDKTGAWRWSKDQFIIQVPDNIPAVEIHCSTPIENGIIFTVGNNQEQMDLKVGDNKLVVRPNGETKIDGKIIVPFQPPKFNPESSDPRTLGICLKKLVIQNGETNVEVSIQELSPRVPPPMSFKL